MPYCILQTQVMQFLSIWDGIKLPYNSSNLASSSLFQFPIGSWLTLHVALVATENWYSLCRNWKKSEVISQHASGCYLFLLWCLKLKLI